MVGQYRQASQGLREVMVSVSEEALHIKPSRLCFHGMKPSPTVAGAGHRCKGSASSSSPCRCRSRGKSITQYMRGTRLASYQPSPAGTSPCFWSVRIQAFLMGVSARDLGLEGVNPLLQRNAHPVVPALVHGLRQGQLRKRNAHGNRLDAALQVCPMVLACVQHYTQSIPHAFEGNMQQEQPSALTQ